MTDQEHQHSPRLVAPYTDVDPMYTWKFVAIVLACALSGALSLWRPLGDRVLFHYEYLHLTIDRALSFAFAAFGSGVLIGVLQSALLARRKKNS